METLFRSPQRAGRGCKGSGWCLEKGMRCASATLAGVAVGEAVPPRVNNGSMGKCTCGIGAPFQGLRVPGVLPRPRSLRLAVTWAGLAQAFGLENRGSFSKAGGSDRRAQGATARHENAAGRCEDPSVTCAVCARTDADVDASRAIVAEVPCVSKTPASG